MNEKLFLLILLIHFLADFALQTHEQATKKSYDNEALMQHVGVYSIIWFFAALMFTGVFWLSLAFAIITFVTHYGTDYWTSRISKPFFEKGDFHNGFVVVGFDQLIHYVTLYYTFKILL